VSTFLDRVACKLDLTIAGATISIEPRQIERFAVSLRPWGYTAEISFRVECRSSPDEDTVFAEFIKPDINEVSAELGRTFEEVGETTEPLKLKGIALDKQVEETEVSEVAGAPVLTRRYTVRFADRGQVCWSQHRPTALYVDSTYDALLAANLPQGMTLTHDWTASSVQRPVLSLGLGLDDSPAHFFDFVCWLADREGVGLYYDPATDAHKIASAKPEVSGPVTLEPEEVGLIEVRLPPVRRAKVSVLNSYTDASEAKKTLDNELAAEGVQAAFLMRSAIAADLDARATLEGTRSSQPLPGARLELCRLPASLPVINKGLAFSDEFSANLFTHGKSFRVIAVDWSGHAVGDEGGVDAEAGRRFEMALVADLEQASDPVVKLPPFARPLWPFAVEGKVVSEVGEDDEETYQIYQDADTSLDLYKVEVPLFENKKVIVLYEPIMFSGQFYFPAYKGERVLLSLSFDRAEFTGYLDWRPGARLPLDGQGNHLLLGKKAASQTSINHVYTDAKPVLTIQRTETKDQQTIIIKDGTIFMSTLEND